MGLSFNRASLLAVAAAAVAAVSVMPAAAADIGVEQYGQQAYGPPPPPPPVAVAPAPRYVVPPPPRYAPLYGCVGCAPLYPYPRFGYRYGPYRPRYYAGYGPWHRHW